MCRSLHKVVCDVCSAEIEEPVRVECCDLFRHTGRCLTRKVPLYISRKTCHECLRVSSIPHEQLASVAAGYRHMFTNVAHQERFLKHERDKLKGKPTRDPLKPGPHRSSEINRFFQQDDGGNWRGGGRSLEEALNKEDARRKRSRERAEAREEYIRKEEKKREHKTHRAGKYIN